MLVAQEIRRRGWSTRVLALSAYDYDHYVQGMLQAGAVGYLLKEEASKLVIEAVRCAASGGSYFSPVVAHKVTAWACGKQIAELTQRELEVLQCVGQGLTNREIARALDIAERTVAFHMSNVFEKLVGVSSRVEAAIWAKEQGLISSMA